MPRRAPSVITALRSSSDRPVVTFGIIGVTVLVYLLQILPGSPVTALGVYRPGLTVVQPWTMLTALFLHAPSSPLHILFNMYSLFVFGPILERMLGRGRFAALYLISGFGGSVAVLLLSPLGGVLGASGAIFGLMGAFFVISRRLGGNNVQIFVVIAINLVSGFLIPGVSWQAHVGGLVVGAAIAFIYLQTRRAAQRNLQILLVSGLAVVLIAITAVAALAL